LYIVGQDTLIVWSEADNYDFALSFQEKAGCDEIWEKICQVRVSFYLSLKSNTDPQEYLYVNSYIVD